MGRGKLINTNTFEAKMKRLRGRREFIEGRALINLKNFIEKRASQVLCEIQSNIREIGKSEQTAINKTEQAFREEIFRIHRTLGGYHPDDPDQYGD